MILLDRNKNPYNIICVSLYENIDFSNITNTNDIRFKFEFINQITKDSYDIELVDMSTHPNYYNLFNLTIVNDITLEDKTNGILYLKDNGFYDYIIRYYLISDPTNLKICKKGIMRLVYNNNNISQHTPNNPVVSQFNPS